MLGLPFKNDCILLRASIAVPRNKNYKQCFVNWHLKILSELSKHMLVLGLVSLKLGIKEKFLILIVENYIYYALFKNSSYFEFLVFLVLSHTKTGVHVTSLYIIYIYIFYDFTYRYIC